MIISHDLGLVRRIADRVVVMLHGRVIEECRSKDLSGRVEHHPHTIAYEALFLIETVGVHRVSVAIRLNCALVAGGGSQWVRICDNMRPGGPC